MVELTFVDASATESGDYYQIHFGEDNPSDSDSQPYFLIQRDFEDDEDTSFYIETNTEEMIDHYNIIRACLTRNSLYLNTSNPGFSEFLIGFKSSQNSFNKIERIFGIMFEGIPS